MDLSSITPLILTYNEEANLARTLDRLTWADRIVVIDSESGDDTRRIAQSYPQVDFITRPFDDHTSQWNFGVDQVKTEWVLALDADYIISDAFTRELSALDDTHWVGGQASFRYCIFGQRLRASLYPPRIVLFRREDGRYVQDGHTQRLSIAGPVKDLQTPIDHDDRKSLRHWLSSQKRYVHPEVEKLRGEEATNRLPDRLRKTRVLAPLVTPLYCLFVKGLILDGWPGWYYTLQRTYAELLLALELLDRDLRAGDGDSSASPDASR